MVDEKNCHADPTAFLDMSKAFDRMEKNNSNREACIKNLISILHASWMAESEK